MKKNIKILLSGTILLTLVVVVFISNINKTNNLNEDNMNTNILNINLSKMIEEPREEIKVDISDIFVGYEDENNKMFEECNSKLVNL